MPKMISRINRNGQIVAEFSLVLPFILLMLLTVAGAALMGARSIVAELAASRGARVAKVFNDELVDYELCAMLEAPLFRGGISEQVGIDRRRRTSNDENGTLIVDAVSNPLIGIRSLAPGGIIRRSSPISPALVPDLSDSALRGDTPSPYCRGQGGYEVCGYE